MVINPDDLVDADIEHEHAWSITARLAAVSAVSVAGVPEEIAALIREARELHPAMCRIN